MATYYPKTGGGNWNTAGTWNTAAGQTTGNAPNAPLATDNIIFDVLAVGTVTVNATTCVCKTLLCQGSSNRIVFTSGQKLTVSGDITFKSGMTITGTGNLTVAQPSATTVLTADTVVFPGSLTIGLGASQIFTLADSWSITGLFTAATSSGPTINGNTLTLTGGLTINSPTTGTTKFIWAGGTWTGNNSSAVNNDIDINCTSGVFASNIRYATGTLKYITGTMTFSGTPTFNITGNCTLDLNGMQLPTLNANASSVTITLLSDFATVKLAPSNGAVLMSFTGAYTITATTVQFISNTGGSYSFTMSAGGTLVITDLFTAACPFNGSNFTWTIKSSVASTSAYLVYQGTADKCSIYNITFTDIDASGSTTLIRNYHGGTLTRTSGILNFKQQPVSVGVI